MRWSCVLLVVVSSLLAAWDGVSANSDFLPTKLSHVVADSTNDGSSRLLRSGKATGNDSEGDSIGDEERAFDDPAITQYLSLFKDWARNKETPESVYQYFELAPRVEKAYKSGKWARLLKNEKYIVYRKYEKYLHLVKAAEAQANMVP
ncbi:hypothetical protein PHYSODRAFT_285617 [Phytophthora sojae]|uniref:RxLR effector protein n=2 Tax=Phytophthora sojae TaxID=67593 RepID=G4Z3C4_PHYSP|nr:hypothetical protein PHYSODRAFT_285617 [Phytophthora sojae]AEK81022.1 Avh247 [Phytophthora sojae]AEK81024.1 Avh247 [Phytophthora sojae]EGZ21487.1 hypothetical protein PHYSODRAFT_285617 [Phytophthora sojae]|eukprot:XP_009524204.1 hypothetical protein PHYSODRAFT_285617 [Phytophthora sojae]